MVAKKRIKRSPNISYLKSHNSPLVYLLHRLSMGSFKLPHLVSNYPWGYVETKLNILCAVFVGFL